MVRRKSVNGAQPSLAVRSAIAYPQNMQAVILLGGQGTRLRTLYADRPKALVPVAGRPFIEWQVKWLRRGGVTQIHLAAGHMADQIKDWAASQEDVTVSQEPKPLGTGGALQFVESHLIDDRFYLVNGDTLLPNLDFQRLENRGQKVSNDWKNQPDFFQRLEKSPQKVPTTGKSAKKVSNDWKIRIAVTQIEEAGRFGTVEFDAHGVITAFREKEERASGWINGGVYRMHRAALADIPPDQFCSLETDLFPRWATEHRLMACPAEPPLLDMGTPEGLCDMERFLIQ